MKPNGSFVVFSMKENAWAMWLPWMGHFRRMTHYHQSKEQAEQAQLELI